jgi:hypothetical protein
LVVATALADLPTFPLTNKMGPKSSSSVCRRSVCNGSARQRDGGGGD